MVCPIDSDLGAENISEIVTKLQATQQTISKLSKKMRPCFTFNKFGDCQKSDCPFLHPQGVLKDGVWVKDTTRQPSESQIAGNGQTAASTSGAGDDGYASMKMSELRQLAEDAGVSKADIKRTKKAEQPKDALIGLLRAAGVKPGAAAATTDAQPETTKPAAAAPVAQATKVSAHIGSTEIAAGGGTDGAGDDGYASMKMSELRQLAEDAGVSKADIKRTKKAEQPKDALIALLRCTVRNGASTPAVSADNILAAVPAQSTSATKNVGDTTTARESAIDDANFLAEWPFETDYGDHFETPKKAYIDVKPLLKAIANDNGSTTQGLRMYDPYYCRGRAAVQLSSLGFDTLINMKRDFYKDIAAGKTPAHEVLLTNPPYSGEHKEKLFRYLLDQQRQGPKPFMLLLPAWTSSKAVWRQFLAALAQIRAGNTSATLEHVTGVTTSRRGDDLEEKAGVCYVCPGEKYEFIAAGAARDTAPFFGIWFCGGLEYGNGQSGTARAVQLVTKAQAARAQSREGYKPATVKTSLRQLQDAGIVRSEAEERERLLANPLQKARRDAAIAELAAKRRADPAARARKNQKKKDARLKTAAVRCPPLPWNNQCAPVS